MPRTTLLRLAAAAVALTVVMSVGLVQIQWFGEQGSTAADEIDLLFDVMVVLSSFVFSVVMVMLGYAIWKYRAKPGDEGDGEPIHGNTRLEIAWTVIPTIIVLVGAAYSWIVLNDIENAKADRDVVNVTAQQYEWSFAYPGGVKSTVLHVPVDKQTQFRLHALDVIHSFWVPQWRIKKDAVPGQITNAYVTPDRVGQFTLVCTELCGYGHSTMRAKVLVQPKADYEKWLSSQEAAAAKAGASGAAGATGAGGAKAGA